MKTKEEMINNVITTLLELEHNTTMYIKNPRLYNHLCTKLQTLEWVLGEEIPEQYWERIDAFI